MDTPPQNHQELDLSDDKPALVHLAPLNPEQLALLRLVWQPIRESMGEGWAQWAWVEDQFESAYPESTATNVLASLPRIRPAFAGWPYYSLVWRSSNNVPQPLGGERIGLTLAGFAYLASDQSALVPLTDRLVQVFRDIAAADKKVKPTPTELAGAEIGFDFFVSDLLQQTLERRLAFSVDSLAEVYKHEYGNPLVLNKQGDRWMLNLDGRRLRRYRDLETAADYFELIRKVDQVEHGIGTEPLLLLPPEVVDLGSTGEQRWRALDQSLEQMLARFSASTTPDDWADVGLRCTAVLIALAGLIKAEATLPKGIEPPKSGDAKGWLGLYLAGRAARKDLKPLIDKAWVLAQAVKHGGESTRADVFATAQATVLVVRTVQQIAAPDAT